MLQRLCFTISIESIISSLAFVTDLNSYTHVPAILSNILLKPSPGDTGIGAADDITCSTNNSIENCFIFDHGLFEAIEWFDTPIVLKLLIKKWKVNYLMLPRVLLKFCYGKFLFQYICCSAYLLAGILEQDPCAAFEGEIDFFSEHKESSTFP